MADFPMTKKQYLLFKEKFEKDDSSVSHEECKKVDDLIKRTTLKNLRAILREMECPLIVREFVVMKCDFGMGSGEVDDFLTGIKAYPEWM